MSSTVMDNFAQGFYERVSSHSSAVIAAVVVLAVSLTVYKRPDLSHIPTAGSTGLLSYYEGYRYIFNAKDVLHEGYSKFRQGPGIFKVASPSRWNIIVASPEMINELRLAKNDEISIDHSAEEEFATQYTVGLDVTASMYHVDTIRTVMTRNLVTKFDEVYDEITQSFEDLISAKEDEWLTIPGLTTVRNIVCRTSNRLFLGERLCRNAEWIDLNINFTIDVFLRAMVINLFPYFLQPIAGTILSPINHAMRVSRKFLQVEVEQRFEMDAEYGRYYEGRPNDLISWLLELIPKEERFVDSVLRRILIVNMAAIHTSSNIFFEALLNLATHPEYAAPMREEVISVTEEYGWTKAALNKMRKLDSFLKETVRCEGMGAVMMQRKIIKKSGYTFADGVHLPYGSLVGVPTFAIHHDAEYYEDPFTFEGFRFSKIREDDGEGLKHQIVSTNLHYLNFGHGKHACPGRFFAATELKAMLAHLLVTYEVKLDSEPKPVWFGAHFAPDDKAKVLFTRLRKESH